MKAKKGFHLRKVCGQNIIVAEGKENIDFCSIISMNESAALLWNEIQDKDFTAEALAEILMDQYQIDDRTPLPHSQALADAESTIAEWEKAGIIEP